MSLTKTELKDIQSLQTKKGRKLKKRFLAEGVRLLEEAARHRARPEVVYYAESTLSDRARLLIDRFAKQAVPTEAIPHRQIEALADTESTQGMVAVFREPPTSLAELYQPNFRRILLCEHIADPGNLGTLMRSALAFGCELIILAGNSAEPYSPKVVRASAGTIFGLPVAIAQTSEVLELSAAKKIYLLASDISGEPAAVQLREIPKETQVMLAVGSEAEGVPPEILSRASSRVRIEHSEAVESLNAAVAGSILMKELYEIRK